MNICIKSFCCVLLFLDYCTSNKLFRSWMLSIARAALSFFSSPCLHCQRMLLKLKTLTESLPCTLLNCGVKGVAVGRMNASFWRRRVWCMSESQMSVCGVWCMSESQMSVCGVWSMGELQMSVCVAVSGFGISGPCIKVCLMCVRVGR